MIILFSILLIIIAILLIIGIGTDEIEITFGSFCRICGGTTGAAVLIFLGIGLLVFEDDKPKAIDVYRGSTELQIEKKVVNDKVVSSDSIVVWKK